ncbi:hypothetical protein PILCRDRAFT_663392 [Piloderma croceum F 1598]|uniref:Uncharacterized protein n=1 Tax=Piloderma croceum (strain F 1598) TaxID=765440 RepID=A0A0C3F7N9_PILCF|nr:hypothetical protein PILCRDRAFT_663392 [Piloderma croceum F 1598]
MVHLMVVDQGLVGGILWWIRTGRLVTRRKEGWEEMRLRGEKCCKVPFRFSLSLCLLLGRSFPLCFGGTLTLIYIYSAEYTACVFA